VLLTNRLNCHRTYRVPFFLAIPPAIAFEISNLITRGNVMHMMKPIAAIKATTAAALFLLISSIAHAQTADRDAVEKVMRDYFEAYSRGDMAAGMKFIIVPFVVTVPSKGFTAFTTADEALDWYTKFHDAAVKQGYAKTQWIDLGVKLLGQSYAIAGGSYVRYKTGGTELNRTGGTYLLNKIERCLEDRCQHRLPDKGRFQA
jgi:ketosteroid isomerase-like protein